MTCIMVGGPILAASLLIGLIISVFQAMTQVQDQSVSFVPKILLLLVMIGLCLPWLTDHMLDFAKQSFETPMTHWQNGQPSDFEPRQDLPSVTPAFETTRSASQRTFSTASFGQPTAKPDFDNVPSLPSTVRSDTTDPLDVKESPFILPHYRFSKIPPTEIGG